jgi:DNA-binding response OmpR family regulator
MQTKILYVEDEVFLGKIVAESLQSRGYEVHWVQDGALVQPALKHFIPDICILDVMLPHLNGFDLGKILRHDHPDIPIIFLTAKDQTEDVLRGFSSGGNDYIRKPFSIEELIVRIENLCRVMTRNWNGGESVPVGKFEFSPLSLELTLNGSTTRLSHREAELLKVLIRHQNLPVERKQILKELWGDDSFFNSRNLDVYITRLRKYLRPDPNLEIITLKGVGYQFVCK